MLKQYRPNIHGVLGLVYVPEMGDGPLVEALIRKFKGTLSKTCLEVPDPDGDRLYLDRMTAMSEAACKDLNDWVMMIMNHAEECRDIVGTDDPADKELIGIETAAGHCAEIIRCMAMMTKRCIH